MAHWMIEKQGQAYRVTLYPDACADGVWDDKLACALVRGGLVNWPKPFKPSPQLRDGRVSVGTTMVTLPSEEWVENQLAEVQRVLEVALRKVRELKDVLDVLRELGR